MFGSFIFIVSGIVTLLGRRGFGLGDARASPLFGLLDLSLVGIQPLGRAFSANVASTTDNGVTQILDLSLRIAKATLLMCVEPLFRIARELKQERVVRSVDHAVNPRGLRHAPRVDVPSSRFLG
jgi:hypothetical protein